MANPPTSSMSKEAWRELKSSHEVWWPWVLGLAAITFGIKMLAPLPPKLDPAALKANPLIALQAIGTIIPSVAAQWLVGMLAVYVLTVVYLGHAVKKNPPQLSMNGFLFWLPKYLIKIFKPILWLLIPIVGFFLYFRSIVRRTPVTPMAVLGRADIINRSWQITEGQVWRIIWNGFKLNFMIWLMGLGVFIVFAIVGWVSHTLAIVNSVCTSLLFAMMAQVNVIFSCTVYRILIKESNANRVDLSTPSTLASR